VFSQFMYGTIAYSTKLEYMVAATGYAATHCTGIFYLFSLNIPIASAAGRKYPSTAALMAPAALAAENILNSNSTFLEKKRI
jgi:hypothetical protein